MSAQPGRAYKMKPCRVCAGSGQVPGPALYPGRHAYKPPVACPECNGRGEVRKYPPRKRPDAELQVAAMLARLDQKDQAIRELCHDLRSSLTPLTVSASGIARSLERGNTERARELARELAERLRARKAVIDAAQDRALGM